MCDRRIYGPQSLKYLPSGPLWKNVADPFSFLSMWLLFYTVIPVICDFAPHGFSCPETTASETIAWKTPAVTIPMYCSQSSDDLVKPDQPGSGPSELPTQSQSPSVLGTALLFGLAYRAPTSGDDLWQVKASPGKSHSSSLLTHLW